MTREAAEDRAGREAVEKEVARFATEVAAVSGVEGKQRVGEGGGCTGGGGGQGWQVGCGAAACFATEVAAVSWVRGSSRRGSVVGTKEAQAGGVSCIIGCGS